MLKYIAALFYFLIIVSCNQNNNKRSIVCENGNIIGEKGNLFIPIKTFININDAKKCSKLTNKPILIMFYANRNIEDRDIIWKHFLNKNILKLINDQYLFIALQTDDNDSVLINKKENKFTSKGVLNSKLENKIFQSNSQPLFAILDSKEHQIGNYVGYSCLVNKNSFIKFLEDGLELFKKK